jgi:RNA polymerase sigma-70 factor (ECF subfamily)
LEADLSGLALRGVGDSMIGAAVREVPTREPNQRPLRELFAELAEGRAAALEGLYDALAGDVYGLALWRTGAPEDAADVLQEVFVRLAQAGPKLRRIRDPRAFALRIAHRASIDVHRRRRRRAEAPLEDVHLVEKDSRSGERALDAERLSKRLGELPPEQREIVYLHAFAGCSFSEAARTLGIPTFTAASRYRLALERLRRLLGAKS